MDATVVVTPKHLVALCGVPEMVRVPVRIGDQTEYTAHGERFVVRKRGRDTWSLKVDGTERVRFGNRKQMAEDIGHTLETGALPHSGRGWA